MFSLWNSHVGPAEIIPMSNRQFHFPVAAIRIVMNGRLPLYDVRVRKLILDLLVSNPNFAPERSGTDERSLGIFDYQAVVELGPNTPSSVLTWLVRQSYPAYRMYLNHGIKPEFRITLSPESVSNEMVAMLFSLGDLFVRSYEPLIGWVHMTYDLHSTSVAKNRLNHMLMDSGSVYNRTHGVGGLGLRTYIGAPLLDRIPVDLVTSLPSPCVVERLSSGGFRVDLEQEPWNSTSDALCESWANAVQHLRPSGFFSEAVVTAPDTWTWSEGKSKHIYD